MSKDSEGRSETQRSITMFYWVKTAGRGSLLLDDISWYVSNGVDKVQYIKKLFLYFS